MSSEFSGETALVTGASQGIGLVIAQALHARGCRIAINSRHPEELGRVAEGLGPAIPIAADVTKPEDARRMIADAVAALGRLDILVCNVGSGRSVPPGSETFEEWGRVLDLNLRSTTNCVEAARDALVASRGAVVCVSSICGVEVIPGAPVTYSVAKAALNAYIRGISKYFGPLGVRINGVAPGNVLFPGSVWDRKLREDPDAVQAMLTRDVALGRLGTPEDVAELVAFLASDKARFVSGAIWTLDGGQVH